MYDPVDTFEIDGFTVELHQDYDAGNPFKEWDQASEILSDVKGYDLGEDVPHPESWYKDTPSSAVMARWLTLFGGYVIALPWSFQDYGSSGARVHLDTPDDDPASGWIVMTQETVDREFASSLEDAERCAKAEFDSFRSWIEGEVLGYVVKNPAGEVVDSCWGFYGDDKYVREEASSVARSEAEEYQRLRTLPWQPRFGK